MCNLFLRNGAVEWDFSELFTKYQEYQLPHFNACIIHGAHLKYMLTFIKKEECTGNSWPIVLLFEIFTENLKHKMK